MSRDKREQQLARLESIVLERTGTPDSNSFITIIRERERERDNIIAINISAVLHLWAQPIHDIVLLLYLDPENMQVSFVAMLLIELLWAETSPAYLEYYYNVIV